MKEVSAKKPSFKQPKVKNSGEKAKVTSMIGANGEFETVDFILKHLRMDSWQDYTGITYTPEEIICLLDHLIVQFQMGKSSCRMSPPVTIVGDLNGNFHDLIRILNIREGMDKEDDTKQVFATQKFVFLGDYTEGNKFNLETICLLFALKICYDKRYILLRGHQEVLMIGEKNEFQEQLIKRFPNHHEEIWKKFCSIYSMMPVAAVVGEKILCIHGGISPEIKKSVDELRKIPRSENADQLIPLVRDLLFACPVDDDGIGADSEDPVYFMSVKRDFTKLFNEAAVREFCAKTKIELIVRSHEVPLHGFRFFSEKRMITIFSTPMYNEYHNKAAILKVSKTGLVSIIQMRGPEKNGEKGAEKKEKTVEQKEKKTETQTEEKSKTEGDKPKSPKSAEKKDKSKEKSKEKSTKKSKEKSKEKSKKKSEKKDKSAENGSKKPIKPSKEIDSVFDNISG